MRFAGCRNHFPQPRMASRQLRLIVNGEEHSVPCVDSETLLTVLRERLQLTGTKLGCGRGECGACTVLVDGRLAYSCLTLAAGCESTPITTVVGQRVPSVDAPEKVTGQARYTADVQRPAMLHAEFVRARVASGKVTRLDCSRALALPGVRGVITAEDVQTISHQGAPLFDTTIHWAGQPIAALCADTPDIARHACALVEVDIATWPHSVTIEDALGPSAPAVRPSGNTPKGQPRIASRGDAPAARAAADVVVTREYRTPCVLHTAIETHGAAAEWTGDALTVLESI